MKNLMILGIFALVLSACGSEQTSEVTSEGHEHEDMTMEEGDGIHFGEKINEDGVIGYSELMTLLAENDSVNAKLVAEVVDVCQKKGCWMNVKSPEGQEAEPIFVQFHDYSFFMPLDLTGQVVIDGYAYRDVTSVEDLQHYAEDAGESEEFIASITEPEEQLKFMATGVKILQQ